VFELVVNTKDAKAIEVTTPSSILVRADRWRSPLIAEIRPNFVGNFAGTNTKRFAVLTDTPSARSLFAVLSGAVLTQLLVFRWLACQSQVRFRQHFPPPISSDCSYKKHSMSRLSSMRRMEAYTSSRIG
jgi:hypothetical protein